MKYAARTVRWTLVTVLFGAAWQQRAAAASDVEPAILIIGASYANGATPFNDAMDAPLGGICVNFGQYLSVGNAIVRDGRLAGFVINEAEAGATTFDRLACSSVGCGPAAWHGYDVQLRKALSRVAVPDPEQPGHTLRYNADHVIVSMPNDCLHADAFGVPQELAIPCNEAELDEVITRLIAVGAVALAHGITPVFEAYPDWPSLDFERVRQMFGVAWTIDEVSYTYLRSQHLTRIANELYGSVVVDPWHDFVHIGDGLHPSPETALKAGRELVLTILTDRNR